MAQGTASQVSFGVRVAPDSSMDGGCFQVLTDRWWLANDAGDLLLLRGRPMCNANKDIAVSLAHTLSGSLAIRLDVVFVPIAFVDVTKQFYG